MKTPACLLAMAVVLGSYVSPALVSESQAQFNPQGRNRGKPKKPAKKPTDSAQRANKAPAQPGAAAAPEPPRPSPEASEPKSEEALIARYTAIVLSQPEAEFPIRRLAELYRQKDGKLDALIADFEKRSQSQGNDSFVALVALAGLYRQAGQDTLAVATYQQAIAKRPQDPRAHLGLAEHLKNKAELSQAKAAYEKALRVLTNPALKEQTERTLLALCLDLEDYACAKERHRALVQLARGSALVEAELGRELLSRGNYPLAVEEFRRVVRGTQGDNRALVPALRDLGRALSKANEPDEALKVLRRALGLAGRSGVATEVYASIADIYRGQGKLSELVGELEAQGGADYGRLKLLAELYEETGQLDRALSAYEKLTKERPKEVGARLKFIALKELQGDLKGAIEEYQKLITHEPRNPDFVFRLAEALIQQGERARALAELEKLEARAQGDEEAWLSLVDYYERLGHSERATQILEKLTQAPGKDTRHLVELGIRYWNADDKSRAIKTWRLVETATRDRASNLLLVGDVYLQHDLTQEALSAYREARKLKPSDRAVERAYALALERAGAGASESQRRRYYDESIEIWFSLLRMSGSDRHGAREARQHIVTLWNLNRTLSGRLGALSLQLGKTPPDLEAGRLLAEAQLRLGQVEQAVGTLDTLVKLAPGDVESWSNLERALTRQGRLKEAISALEQLVALDPKSARQHYQRMAEHAGALYRDADALRYAARALELNPDDAEGHRRLGEMYRRRNLPDKAIESFRQAIAKNDRLFPVYFDLAELLLSREKAPEADRLMRRVMRSAVDDELITRSVRVSIQINQSTGSLEDLEHDLFQVALSRPNKPLYRELLVEMYGALAFPLIAGAGSSDADIRHDSQKKLTLLGDRSIKPLLDALTDPKGKQKGVAIELLSHIANPGAGPALITFATGESDLNLRARAMLAAANLKDPKLLPRFREVLLPGGKPSAFEGDPVSVGAAFGVANLERPEAAPLLATLLASDAPSIQALAALGLGWLKHRPSAPALLAKCASPSATAEVRAASARALARIGYQEAVPTLKQLAWSETPVLRQNALLSLASLAKDADKPALASALWDANPKTREVARWAAHLGASGQAAWSDRAPVSRLKSLEIQALLDVGGGAATPSPEDLARAFVWLRPELAQSAVTYIQASSDGAKLVAQSLGGTAEAPEFLPLLSDVGSLPPDTQREVYQEGRKLLSALLEPFQAQSSHPSVEERQLALEFLARFLEAKSASAFSSALKDPAESVRLIALDAIAARRFEAFGPEVAQVLMKSRSWRERLRAASTLSALGSASVATSQKALETTAREDRNAWVRLAAIEALAKADAQSALPLLSQVADRDADPQVRARARSLLVNKGP